MGLRRMRRGRPPETHDRAHRANGGRGFTRSRGARPCRWRLALRVIGPRFIPPSRLAIRGGVVFALPVNGSRVAWWSQSYRLTDDASVADRKPRSVPLLRAAFTPRFARVCIDRPVQQGGPEQGSARRRQARIALAMSAWASQEGVAHGGSFFSGKMLILELREPLGRAACGWQTDQGR